MFRGSVVWRGVVYAVLMAFAKMCTGLWLVRISPGSGLRAFVRVLKAPLSYTTSCIWGSRKSKETRTEKGAKPAAADSQLQESTDGTENPGPNNPSPSNSETDADAITTANINTPQEQTQDRPSASLPPKPKSLYPASILALAMTARGEIGYLIASLAESNGIFGDTSQGSSETYLVVVWAISLCTLVGPIAVGTLVKRVKTLQRKRADSGGPDPLGVWGI